VVVLVHIEAYPEPCRWHCHHQSSCALVICTSLAPNFCIWSQGG